METQSMKPVGHSADVRITLTVNGHSFSVAQLGPGFVVLRNPFDHQPDSALLSMSIDGDLKQWQIELVDGIIAAQNKTRIVYCDNPIGR